MLLETLDIKKNDVLIFSENKFDLQNNFKVCYKQKSSKKPVTISLNEVGNFINAPVPKSLIVYRLLTNQPSFNANITKYGFFLKIQGNVELIYFDPIFAIKDIEHIKNNINFETFRFKIQQVGLTSNSKMGSYLDFSEIYAFDLKAEEAKNQNDRVYAEAIFAFDISFSGEEAKSVEEIPIIKNEHDISKLSTDSSKVFVRAKIDFKDKPTIENTVTVKKEIIQLKEDKNKEQVHNNVEQRTEKQVSVESGTIVPKKVEPKNVDFRTKESETINFREPFNVDQGKIKEYKAVSKNIPDSNKRKNETLIQEKFSDKEKTKSSISDFLQKKKQNIKQEKNSGNSESEQNKLVDLFKSSSSLGSFLKDRGKESFILKIEK
ncbi:MAG: hypothetical protein NTX22_04730 [Ignavibacteriales bacterium]|nr:hypothetical protein [Ignavibacteriales bacterium]